jgi:hypothetical protein
VNSSNRTRRSLRSTPRLGARRVQMIWLIGVATVVVASAAMTVASHAAGIYPEDKAARVQAEQAQRAAQQANPRPKPSEQAGRAAAAAANPAPPTRQAGIDDMHQGPFPASSFIVHDFYQGPAQGTWLLVYAGATRDLATGATQRGALQLYAEPQVGGPLTPVGTFAAPTGASPLRVVAAAGTRLTLRTDAGQQLTFDLGTHQYSS